MALLDKPIEVAFVADDSQIREVMARVGKQSEAMSGKIKDSSEAGRLGLWSLGESAENLAQSFGVPNQMSRQLGTSVERLAGTFGGLTVALGIAGLAASAAYAIWQQLNETKQRAREESEKNVRALQGEIEQLYGGKIASSELTAAQRELLRAKRDLFLLELDQKIHNERQALEENRKSVDRLLASEEGLRAHMGARYEQGKEVTKQLYEQSIAERQLAANIAYRKSLLGATEKFGQDEQAAKHADSVFAMLQDMRNRSALAGLQGDERELAQIDQRHAAEIERLKAHKAAISDIKEAEAIQDMERAEIVARQRARLEEQHVQNVRQTAGNIAQIGQLMASMGGNSARKWFSLQKTASIAEAIINTYTGATKALAQGGIYGGALAASVIALGMAQVAKIRAQTFDGGGGSSAIGTFSANPVTGLPEGGGSRGDIYISIDGGQNFDKLQLATDIAGEIYRNNGSVGGFSVSVERSA